MEGPSSSSREPSAALQWPPIARLIAREAQIAARAQAHGMIAAGFYEFLRFGVKQGWACLFGGLFLSLLIATRLWYPQHAALARYDFLVIGAVAIQALMLFFRLETWGEAKVIFVFHVVGTVMEIYKTATGSWLYPEPSLLRIGGVPLFSGFMYACVGSYIARAWRLFHFHFSHHPSKAAMSVLSVAIYANFFTDHYGIDIRLLLIAATAILFGRTIIYFKVWQVYRSMPLLLGFTLVAIFIWLAENIGTFMGAWMYPSQARHWTFVPVVKLEAWFMLMIISYTLTALSRPLGVAEEETAQAPLSILS